MIRPFPYRLETHGAPQKDDLGICIYCNGAIKYVFMRIGEKTREGWRHATTGKEECHIVQGMAEPR